MSTRTAPPARFLQASFHPPQIQIPLLQRLRLIERLEVGLRVRLLLLTAPAGCGKSTLLMQWFHSLRERGVTCAWLNIVRDGGAADLLQSIGWALELNGVAIRDTGALEEASGEASDFQESLALMLSAVAQLERQVVLICDEFERLRDPESLALMELLVAVSPPNLHIVLATRRRPEFSISSLHAQGMVASVVAEDLLFSGEEARSLLTDVAAPEEVETILGRTEGWPVAVTLAKLWFGQGGGKSKTLAEFRGSISDISAYLTEQVIAGVRTELREFLLDVSVLDHISPAVADAVRGRADSFALLQELKELQPMVTTLDSTEPVLRLHPLLAEHLVQLLRISDQERYLRLQERAAAACINAGRLLEGVAHALKADNAQLGCVLLVSQAPIRICVMRGSAAVSACLRQLPQQQWRQHPRLRLCEIFILMRRGEHARGEAEYRLLTAEHADPSVECMLECFTIEALLGMRSPILGKRKIEELEAAYRACGKQDPWARVVIDTLALVVHLACGNLESAKLKLEEQRRAYAELPLSGSALHTDVHACHIMIEEGQLSNAETGLRRVLRVSRSIAGPDKSITVIARTSLVRVLYEMDRDELSEAELGNLLDDLDRTDAWFDAYATAYSIAIESAYRTSGFAEASRLISKARIAARRQVIGESFEHLLLTLEADLLTREGNIEGAARWLESVNCTGAAPVSYYERDALCRATARLALARDRPQEALVAAARLMGDALAHGRNGARCRAELIEAIALERLGRVAESRNKLIHALDWAAAEGAVAPFLEFRHESKRLLQVLKQAGLLSAKVHEDFLTSLGERIGHGPQMRRLHGMLTKRELEILELLRSCASNKHIARAIDISEDAVKFHLKNVYRKLGVHSRAEALAALDSAAQS